MPFLVRAGSPRVVASWQDEVRELAHKQMEALRADDLELLMDLNGQIGAVVRQHFGSAQPWPDKDPNVPEGNDS